MKLKIMILLMLFPVLLFSQTFWEMKTTGNTFRVNSISSPEPNHVWICSDQGIVWHSTNGGNNWINNSGLGNNISVNLHSICAVDQNVILVAGSDANSATVWRTTNGGGNWNIVFIEANGFINSINFKDANNGFMMGDVIGGRWSLWKTINGGAGWDSVGCYLPGTNGQFSLINDMCYNEWGCWFGDNSGKIFFSSNLQNWTTFSTPVAGQTTGIWFNSATLGLMCYNDTLFRTTNGGQNWGRLNIALTAGDYATGYNTEFWTGNGNIICYSSNSGVNWSNANQVFAITISCMTRSKSVIGNLTTYAGLNDGRIMKYSGSPFGIQQISTNVPGEFNLSQNYPNPFNPVTNFEFSVPKADYVKISVFDILGKEIENLLNRQLQPGTYKVDWDASNYPSGTYFYRMSTTDFTETKKMILIK